MLIMTYAHARTSGDGSLISRYVRTKLLSGICETNNTGQYSLLTSWADYLSNSTLLIHNQCVIYVGDSDYHQLERSPTQVLCGWTVNQQSN